MYLLKVDDRDHYLSTDEVLDLARQCDWLVQQEGLVDKTLPRKRITLSILETPMQSVDRADEVKDVSGPIDSPKIYPDPVWARKKDPSNEFKVHFKHDDDSGWSLCGVFLGKFEFEERNLRPDDQICKNCLKVKK